MEKDKSYVKNLLENNIFGVSAYLTVLNSILNTCEAKVKGETSEVKKWSSGHVYFSLKDKKDGSVMNCVIWNYDYRLSGLELKDGMEIVATGIPDVYKPTGRLSFKAKTVRLVGEGELKKEYEKLKKKLEDEGLFREEKKREIPQFPKTIGVITSKQGAVINDFLNNIGRYGFKIKFIDSRVEGEEATKDLLAAIKTMRKQPIDALVVMRGGGSLESFLAFNNEILVKEVSNFPVPVIAAIGHDKDVPLLALAADKMVSTPTAAANLLSESWQTFTYEVRALQVNIINNFSETISLARRKAKTNFSKIESYLQQSLKDYAILENKVRFVLPKILENKLAQFKQQIQIIENTIKHNDPERNLKLGYSLARYNGKLIRKTSDIKVGNEIDLQVYDGEIKSNIIKIEPKGRNPVK